ncbi:MAG TPA: HNH endonuclease signature motif containing protein [Anaerolineae bacterium]|nr:HNH endonuclease signature motif containing protein [Anaerolineae bacterium]HXW00602.1 HNH endonuclease signature motif containing protein [Anaerolineae bacterium]
MSTQPISAALRQRVAAAARFRCGYCLTSQQIIGPLLEIDHIIPEAKGGTSDEENLFLACPMCNSHKATRLEATDPESLLAVPLLALSNKRPKLPGVTNSSGFSAS